MEQCVHLWVNRQFSIIFFRTLKGCIVALVELLLGMHEDLGSIS